jgi:hypothetical protein
MIFVRYTNASCCVVHHSTFFTVPLQVHRLAHQPSVTSCSSPTRIKRESISGPSELSRHPISSQVSLPPASILAPTQSQHQHYHVSNAKSGTSPACRNERGSSWEISCMPLTSRMAGFFHALMCQRTIEPWEAECGFWRRLHRTLLAFELWR